jgi:glucosylceramidase
MTIKWISSSETAAWQTRSPGAKAAGNADLSLTGERFQTIKGFGGCFNERGWEALQRLNPEQRKDVIDKLFAGKDGCGFTFCRVPVGANDYALDWYSLNETDGDLAMKHFSIDRDRGCLIPYIREAMKRQPTLALFASPWSPPTWMKTFKAYNYGSLRPEPAVLEAYALYFQKFVEAYAKEGVRIEQIHVQNEPYSNQKFPSCLMPATQMRDFIRDYLGPRFAREKVPCEIWAGTLEKGLQHGWAMDESQSYAQLAHLILKDPQARQYIKGVGFQWDGKGLVQRVHQAWPDLALSQTENECGDGTNTWAYAFYIFDLLWHYINNGASAYIYWNMVLASGGESTWGWKQNSMVCISDDGKVHYNPEFYVMKHLAHFVKPAARRLGLRGPWSAFAMAFENPDGSTVILAANPYQREETMALELGGAVHECVLPARSLNTLSL